MLQTYKGSCHCGRVTFEVRANLNHVIDCNCSLCRRRGALWHAVEEPDLHMLTGQADLVLYQFNTKTAKHYFCSHCGIHPFIRPRLDPSRWAVNVRCIEDVNLSDIPIHTFDGEHWEEAAKAFFERRRQGSVA